MPRIARSEPSRARVIIGLAGLAAIGAGAAGALARQHDLGPSLARVQPGLRAPLLVVGRGRTGEPEPPTPEGRPPLLASRIPERVIPRGLGRRAAAASEGREVPVWLYEAPGREQHGTSGLSSGSTEAASSGARPRRTTTCAPGSPARPAASS